MIGRTRVLMAAGAALALVAAACGGGGDETPEGGGANSVNVELRDFSLTPDPTSAAAGTVTFAATNAGPSGHELVVLRTDLAPGDLPVKGAEVDESASGIEVEGQIGEFSAGETESASFELTSGSYVLICNIPGHYQAGMSVAFEVT